MFQLYKKELQAFFFTPFAYIITGLFMLLFTYILNTTIADMDSSMLSFSFNEVFIM